MNNPKLSLSDIFVNIHSLTLTIASCLCLFPGSSLYRRGDPKTWVLPEFWEDQCLWINRDRFFSLK